MNISFSNIVGKPGGGGVWGERKNFGRTIFNKLTEICTVFQYHFRKFIKIFPTIITFQNIMLHFLMNYIFLPNERVVKIAKIPRQNCNITTWGCGLSPPPPNAHTHIHTHYTHTHTHTGVTPLVSLSCGLYSIMCGFMVKKNLSFQRKNFHQWKSASYFNGHYNKNQNF